jgi:hypothetical protein
MVWALQGAHTLSFAQQLERYYCSASWICRAFQQMSVPELVEAWPQLVTIMSDARYNWFYAYDMPQQYQRRLGERYGTITRYLAESIDGYWLRECVAYHEFLTKWYVDTQRMVVVQSEPDKTQTAERRFVQVRTFLMSSAPDAIALFYQFFYQHLSNVMINKMNYIYESAVPLTDEIAQLLQDHELLASVYYMCTHGVEVAPDIAQKLANNYQAIESLEMMVALKVLKGE